MYEYIILMHNHYCAVFDYAVINSRWSWPALERLLWEKKFALLGSFLEQDRHGILFIIYTNKICKICCTQPYWSIFNVKCGKILKFYMKIQNIYSSIACELAHFSMDGVFKLRQGASIVHSLLDPLLLQCTPRCQS